MTAGWMIAMTARARLVAITAQIVTVIPRPITVAISLLDLINLFMSLSFPIERLHVTRSGCAGVSGGAGSIAASTAYWMEGAEYIPGPKHGQHHHETKVCM